MTKPVFIGETRCAEGTGILLIPGSKNRPSLTNFFPYTSGPRLPCECIHGKTPGIPVPENADAKRAFLHGFNREMIASEPAGLRGRISSAAIPKQLNTRITDYI